ncbi:polyphosphate:AMP phosphotransferase [Parathalassolituus penaei]|uniref:Polyphosphate:AMP phosphotransferase n=1 Tax=Parathalassolituus penaei TaxID=2997323 RepID=A0A9X3IQP9_9GAMM|nr:polyphosphate:AMP phosphotransferase [Parathalassolituus penaei]MCY0964026.1 polyphosphate:AMP phosphotransferase [Parathalassolituus penaei]
MFEVAELGHKLSGKEYDKKVPDLRAQLLMMQESLKQADFPVIVLLSGGDGAGKGEMLNRLNEWLDPRYMRAFAFDEPSEGERQRPLFWRYWRALPARGRIGLFVGSWYSHPIGLRMEDKLDDGGLDASLQRVNNFERELVADGALILKFWLHLSRDEQKKRLQKLESDPATAWRVSEQDRQHLKTWDKYRKVAERTLRETSTAEAPWIIVESTDRHYRDICIGQHILEAVQRRLHQASTAAVAAPAMPPSLHLPERPRTLLNHLDLSVHLSKKTYEEELEHWQGRLNVLTREAASKKISSVLVLEGWDAAGKGGLIRRMVPALDARHYQIIPIAAPTDEERAHHYLWRFWRHVPRAGKITIYDRSWYGRVLVERVEGFATPAEWMRAYGEINDFEEQLQEQGAVLMKYWLHIDPDEQLKRFREREAIPYKQYKITEEDYRNRERWPAYEQAVNDMVERTSTEFAPWTLIEANDKRYARIKAIKAWCEALEKRLGKGE